MVTSGLQVNKKNLRAEANVVKELAISLDKEGIETSLEYRIKRTRVDLVVIKDNMVKCCIEVKKKSRKKFNTDTRQYNKYNNIGIPTIYCMGSGNIDKTVKVVKDKMLKDLVEVEMIILN